MKELAEKIQMVMNTLEGIEIKSTVNNMDRLLGSLQMLGSVRDELNNVQEVNVDE